MQPPARSQHAVQFAQHRDVVDVFQHVLGQDLREPVVGEGEGQAREVVNDVDSGQRRHVKVDPPLADVIAATEIEALTHELATGETYERTTGRQLLRAHGCRCIQDIAALIRSEGYVRAVARARS
jgi:hypothetical protein